MFRVCLSSFSAEDLVGHACFRVFVCIWPKSTSFSNGDRVELVSCVVYHLSRRPWKVELLTGSMLAIVCAVGKEIDAFGNLDTEMTGWTHRCHFTCEKCTGVVRCPTDRKEMAACACWLLLGHAARAMPLGGFGQLPELLRIQNRGPFIFRSRPRWSIASKLITSAAALKRASSSRWQSCWQCCCQSSRTMLPAELATTPCNTMQPS